MNGTERIYPRGYDSARVRENMAEVEEHKRKEGRDRKVQKILLWGLGVTAALYFTFGSEPSYPEPSSTHPRDKVGLEDTFRPKRNIRGDIVQDPEERIYFFNMPYVNPLEPKEKIQKIA